MVFRSTIFDIACGGVARRDALRAVAWMSDLGLGTVSVLPGVSDPLSLGLNEPATPWLPSGTPPGSVLSKLVAAGELFCNVAPTLTLDICSAFSTLSPPGSVLAKLEVREAIAILIISAASGEISQTSPCIWWLVTSSTWIGRKVSMPM